MCKILANYFFMRLIQKGLVEHETDQRRCEKHSDHRPR